MSPRPWVPLAILFDSVLDDLDRGTIDWATAYRRGFSGEDSRFYFVGMEMARALGSARGARYSENYFAVCTVWARGSPSTVTLPDLRL